MKILFGILKNILALIGLIALITLAWDFIFPPSWDSHVFNSTLEETTAQMNDMAARLADQRNINSEKN